MTRVEAARILGLRTEATEDKIKEAHRRIMIANHPDAGGSSYIAAKVCVPVLHVRYGARTEHTKATTQRHLCCEHVGLTHTHAHTHTHTHTHSQRHTDIHRHTNAYPHTHTHARGGSPRPYAQLDKLASEQCMATALVGVLMTCTQVNEAKDMLLGKGKTSSTFR